MPSCAGRGENRKRLVMSSVEQELTLNPVVLVSGHFLFKLLKSDADDQARALLILNETVL